MSKYSYVDAYLDATNKFMKKRTKRYFVELSREETSSKTIVIDAIDLKDANKIARRKADDYWSGSDEEVVYSDCDIGHWFVSSIKEMQS